MLHCHQLAMVVIPTGSVLHILALGLHETMRAGQGTMKREAIVRREAVGCIFSAVFWLSATDAS